jgi:predicted secreted protein
MELSSKDIGLYYNTGTVALPVWKLVACSTTDGFSGSTDAVTVSNKCEGGWIKSLPGDKSWSFSNASYAKKLPDANQISYEEVFELWTNDALGQWKLESIIPGDYLRIGEGYISSLGETADSGDYLQFDITVTGNGPVTNVLGT